MTEYVITGREVGNAQHWLNPNSGAISDSPGAGLVPLDVEFIGRLMVELSNRGEEAFSDTEIAAFEDQIKHALEVKVPAGSSGQLSKSTAAALWKAAAVKIIFEKRIEGPVDGNTRLLIVPADGTLGVTDAALSQMGGTAGQMPALAYPLDQSLILAALRDRIVDGVAAYASDPTEADALRQHVENLLDVLIDQTGATSHILTSPQRAFHRGVGIYATNMCR